MSEAQPIAKSIAKKPTVVALIVVSHGPLGTEVGF